MTDAPAGPVVAPGARVRLEYRILLADGTLAEDSGAAPLPLTVGAGEFPDAIERAMLGMRAGETGAFEFAPFEVWGDTDPERIQDLPASDFAAGPAPEAGQVVEFTLPDGTPLAGTVLAVGAGRVRVDFNHPLHNRSIRVDVRILSIEPAE